MKIFLLVLFLIIVTFISYGVVKTLRTPDYIGIKDGKLSPCGSAPKCVSSSSKGEQYVPAIQYQMEDPLPLLKEILQKKIHAKIVQEKKNYLHAVVVSDIFHYRDDLEFLVNPKTKTIEVRSEARFGYYDFGINKKRMEEIKQAFQKEEKNR